jgi:hypothetical protein
MSFVKNLFWEDEETVLQFHPKNRSTKTATQCLPSGATWLDHPLPDRIMV